MTVSIIGTGGMAAAIGGLATKAGHTVEVISRDIGRAQALAKRLGPNATTGTLSVAPVGEIVILAVPYSAVLAVVTKYGEGLAGKILADITNPVAPDLTSFVTPENSFGAQEIKKAAPADATVINAFNTHFSHILAAGSLDGRPLDIFLAGDDARAKDRLSEFVESIGLRAFDIGGLLMARTLEHVCLLSLGLMTHSIKSTDYTIGVSFPG